MEHEAGAREGGVARFELPNVAAVDRDVRMASDMRQVRLMSAGEIVDHPHREAAGHEQINHVAADEAGASGDDRDRPLAHAAFSRCSRFTLK